MKLRLLSFTMITLLFISCSKEDVTQTEEINFVTTTVIPEEGSRTPSFSSFVCDPAWVAPETTQGLGDIVYTVYYSDDPADYGFTAGTTVTAEMIHCVRQEYFFEICTLYMHVQQNSNMFIDTWVHRTLGCAGKDDVETATNSDDRVCTGSDCD